MYSSSKKKGLRMTPEVMSAPELHKMRVVVAFDAYDRTVPYLYVLNGGRNHMTEHQIRYTYTRTTDCPYFDTRVILYDTFVARNRKNHEPIEFGNSLTDLISENQ